MTDQAVSAALPDLHLTIANHGGSVEHFHHFLLGFLVPLVIHARSSWQNPRYGSVLIRSCGPMDNILRQLKCARLRITDKMVHRQMGEGRSRLAGIIRGLALGGAQRRYMTLRGYDYPLVYNARAFDAARDALSRILAVEIAAAKHALDKQFPTVGPRILVVDRGAADPFYLSDAAEAKQAGTGRRSIPNCRDMVDTLSRDLGFVLCRTLEGLQLAEQIALFSSVDMVIAQHGAALSNLIWARPGTAVLEIMPVSLPKDIQDIGFFSNLADCRGLRHRFVRQDGDHAPVDPDAVCRVARQLVAS